MPYPDEIDSFREMDNIPGLDYNPEDLKTIFAEDFNDKAEAIVNIENTLGVNPQGEYDTVVERLDAGGGGGGGDTTVQFVHLDPTFYADVENTTTNQPTGLEITITEPGDYFINVYSQCVAVSAATGLAGFYVLLYDVTHEVDVPFSQMVAFAQNMDTDATYYMAINYDVPFTITEETTFQLCALIDPVGPLTYAVVGGGSGSEYGISYVKVVKRA